MNLTVIPQFKTWTMNMLPYSLTWSSLSHVRVQNQGSNWPRPFLCNAYSYREMSLKNQKMEHVGKIPHGQLVRGNMVNIHLLVLVFLTVR